MQTGLIPLTRLSPRESRVRKRRERGPGRSISGAAWRQASPQSENNLSGVGCIHDQHGPCTRRGLLLLADREARSSLREATRFQAKEGEMLSVQAKVPLARQRRERSLQESFIGFKRTSRDRVNNAWDKKRPSGRPGD